MIDAISKLVRRESLTEDEAAVAMAVIMSGDATPIQIAGFITALRVKGESVDEIAGLARKAREVATKVDAGDNLLDTCGTGGDALGTFNISTLSAIVAAACGARVAKHGNRAASSLCGSADVLEALGVTIDLGPRGVERCVREAGIAFLFAPVYHPSFKYAALPRRELGVRTVFNILGPLCNPAHATNQALGVADASLAPTLAAVLERLGVKRAIVFHASDGMDELTTSGPSQVIEVMDGKRREYELSPGELGFERASVDALRGGTPPQNAAIARDVLQGAGGPRRDVVLLNSAAALRAAGLAGDWRDGIAMAAEAIDIGEAGRVLERWVSVSRAAA